MCHSSYLDMFLKMGVYCLGASPARAYVSIHAQEQKFSKTNCLGTVQLLVHVLTVTFNHVCGHVAIMQDHMILFLLKKTPKCSLLWLWTAGRFIRIDCF